MKPAQTPVRGSAVLQQLLTQLALALLPRGMTPRRFSELARWAFVQAAADISRLRNGRINHSRVAAQTGLTRAEVKRFLKYNAFASRVFGQTPVERVIEGWRTDRRFLLRCQPKSLPIYGKKDSFELLVKRFGGDVPHRAVLDELRRIGAVGGNRTSVSLRHHNLRRRQDFAFLSPILPVLLDALTIASAKTRSRDSPIQRLCIPIGSELDLALVRDRCTTSAKSMLEGVRQSLGKQVTVPSSRRPPGFSFAITVLLAENPIKRHRRAPDGVATRQR